MLSCLTNDEMLVCLKYCLTQLACSYHVSIDFDRHLRQDFGELGRRRHDEGLIGARPRDEVLDTLILEHAVEWSAMADQTVTSAAYL